MNTSQAQTRTPVYELFFAPLQVVLNPTDYERVQFAYFLSKFGHAKQFRDDGTRYFDHPKGAAWVYIHELSGRDPDIIILLLLHDMPEDSYLLSFFRFGMNFGAELSLDGRALTKLQKGKETTADYLGRVIERGPKVILVKLCDRLHNNRSLHNCSPEKRKKQIEETREYHLKLLIPALRSYGGKFAENADDMEEMILEALAQYTC